ncbi:GNAT family N-acetyltransferase [Spiractinospora alimapuensis]|uniref:GNAT family N-acetyltransferase n=1 Tax=Spiractinospora alimapuensis TaxID=2820884 RepID=UPI001F3C543D|nr:GNAT family N-acetyltransferase [Spiractinospora alimapuensis]QVQ51598.1 GNAT family N-acetyltransferase [Spiractinospora alimapuensis]
MIDAERLDLLSDRAWPGLTNIDVDGWLVRTADGFTKRANSVLALHEPADVDAAIDQVQELYAARGLAPTFHISDAVRPSDLEARLEKRGYEARTPTLNLAAELSTVLERLRPARSPVEVRDSPSEAWLDAWWDVDRPEPRERYWDTARQVLTRGPALFGQIPGTAGGGSVRAVGRLALVEDWGGLACLGVRPEARGNGDAGAVIGALARAAQRRGVRHLWLQVVPDNEVAQRVYERLGFTEVGRYHYLTLT